MRKILIFILLIFAIFLNAKSYKEWNHLPTINYEKLKFGTDKTLEIATWNIQTFPKRGDTTIVYVAKCIKAMDADIIALQEIKGKKAFFKLIKELNKIDKNNHWKGFRANTNKKWHVNLAFIYKANIIKVKKIYSLFNRKDEKFRYIFPRYPLVMEFVYNNQKFILINNHLKARGGEKNRERRRKALIKLYKYVMKNFPNDNVIIVGDMNDQLTDPKNLNVFTIFLNDKKDFKFADYKIAADTLADWSYPYWKYRGHIDHIIISDELFDEFSNKFSSVKTIAIDKYMEGGDEARYQFITDHRPVAIKLYIH